MTIYIARFYSLGAYSYRRIDDEVIFSTFTEAEEYIKKESFDFEPSPSDYKMYRSEIVEYRIQNKTKSKKLCTWMFDISGKQLAIQKKDEHDTHEPIPDQKFERGDLVEFIESCDLPYITQYLGVVRHAEASESNSYTITINFISELGYFDHTHIHPSYVRMYNRDVPNELKFLRQLSEHDKGIRRIKNPIFREIEYGNIFLKNIRTLHEDDFE